MSRAVALWTLARTVERFDPSQLRGPDGRWVDSLAAIIDDVSFESLDPDNPVYVGIREDGVLDLGFGNEDGPTTRFSRHDVETISDAAYELWRERTNTGEETDGVIDDRYVQTAGGEIYLAISEKRTYTADLDDPDDEDLFEPVLTVGIPTPNNTDEDPDFYTVDLDEAGFDELVGNLERLRDDYEPTIVHDEGLVGVDHDIALLADHTIRLSNTGEYTADEPLLDIGEADGLAAAIRELLKAELSRQPGDLASPDVVDRRDITDRVAASVLDDGSFLVELASVWDGGSVQLEMDREGAEDLADTLQRLVTKGRELPGGYGIPRATEAGFNRGQLRDAEGQWAEMPGAGLVDKLKLASRIELADGETFVASDQSPDTIGDGSAVMALLTTPNGPRLILGFVHAEDTRKWKAEARGGTVELDMGGVSRVRNTLAELDETGRREAAAMNERVDAYFQADSPLDFAVDVTVAEGHIEGNPEWGHIAYAVELTDDDPTSWRTRIGVTPDKDYSVHEAEFFVDFEPKDVRRLIRRLDAMTALAQAAHQGEAAVSAEPVVAGAVERFDPKQLRDDEGQWAKIPGAGLLDKLKLAGRIELAGGERFAGSGSVADSDGLMLLGAAVDTPSGRRIHLGVGIYEDDKKNWRGAHAPAELVEVDDEDGEEYSTDTGSDSTVVLDAADAARLPAVAEDVIARATASDKDFRQDLKAIGRLYDQRAKLEAKRFGGDAVGEKKISLDASVRQEERIQERRRRYVERAVDRLSPAERAAYDERQRKIDDAGRDAWEPGKEAEAAEVSGLAEDEFAEMKALERIPWRQRTSDQERRLDELAHGGGNSLHPVLPPMLAEQAALVLGLTIDEFREMELLDAIPKRSRHEWFNRGHRVRTEAEQARLDELDASPRGATGANQRETDQLRGRYWSSLRGHHSAKTDLAFAREDRAAMESTARPLDAASAAELERITAELNVLDDRFHEMAGDVSATAEIPSRNGGALVIEAIQDEEGGVTYRIARKPPDADEDWSASDNDAFSTTAPGLRNAAKLARELSGSAESVADGAAAEADTTVGDNRLKHYWTRGKGLSRAVRLWALARTTEGHAPRRADTANWRTDALIVALGVLSTRGPAREAAWDPAKHPRIPKGQPGAGRFMSLVERVRAKLQAHLDGGDGDPFEGFSREQLRRAAKARGVTVPRGVSRDAISKLLLHIDEPAGSIRSDGLDDLSDSDVEDGELIIDRANLQRVEDARTIADLRAVARDRGLRIPSYLKRSREVRLWLHTELRLRPGEDVDSYLARTGGRPEAVASARPSSSSSGLERLMGGAYGTVPGERRAAPASGGAFTKQAARRASRSADIPPAARVREQLLQSTPDERRSLLAAYGMNKTQAREVARGLGIKNAGRMDVPNVIDRILSHFRAAGEPSGSRPISRPSPVDPVSGRISDRPLLPNTWGTFAQVGPGDINFHDHGPIGRAIHGMGDDRHLEVDGDALANVLGRIATDVVVGRVTAEQALGRYKQIRDRLPEGSTARYHLDVAIDNIDAPDSPVPATPPYTLAPLQRLLHDLHGVPLVRREPDTEEQPLLQILDDFAAGRLGGLRFIQAVRQLRNRRHESLGDSGKFEIDRAVDRAVAALEELRRTDRQALTQP